MGKRLAHVFPPLKMQPNQYHSIHFTYKLHDHTLAKVEHSKYVCITLQSNLLWNKHINTITNKANQYLGLLWMNLKIKSSDVKSDAYKALVRPKLEYASVVWDPHTRTQINQIENVQRRAARYVTKRYHNTSAVTYMLQHLNCPSLEIRRTRIRLIMFYKNNSPCCCNLPTRHFIITNYHNYQIQY